MYALFKLDPFLGGAITTAYANTKRGRSRRCLHRLTATRLTTTKMLGKVAKDHTPIVARVLLTNVLLLLVILVLIIILVLVINLGAAGSAASASTARVKGPRSPWVILETVPILVDVAPIRPSMVAMLGHHVTTLAAVFGLCIDVNVSASCNGEKKWQWLHMQGCRGSEHTEKLKEDGGNSYLHCSNTSYRRLSLGSMSGRCERRLKGVGDSPKFEGLTGIVKKVEKLRIRLGSCE
jgi:uncharacterized paraquat-inducible protein A